MGCRDAFGGTGTSMHRLVFESQISYVNSVCCVVASSYSRAATLVAASPANCATFAVSSGHFFIKTLLAHPGTQYSAQLARQLHRHNCLHRFWTSFALSENSLIERALRGCMRTPSSWLGNRRGRSRSSR